MGGQQKKTKCSLFFQTLSKLLLYFSLFCFQGSSFFKTSSGWIVTEKDVVRILTAAASECHGPHTEEHFIIVVPKILRSDFQRSNRKVKKLPIKITRAHCWKFVPSDLHKAIFTNSTETIHKQHANSTHNTETTHKRGKLH